MSTINYTLLTNKIKENIREYDYAYMYPYEYKAFFEMIMLLNNNIENGIDYDIKESSVNKFMEFKNKYLSIKEPKFTDFNIEIEDMLLYLSMLFGGAEDKDFEIKDIKSYKTYKEYLFSILNAYFNNEAKLAINFIKIILEDVENLDTREY